MNSALRSSLLALVLSAPVALGVDEKFVVHEWGVQVIVGKAGEEQILTAPEEFLDGLPKWVGRNTAPLRFEAHGWDKPVIHLYGREGMAVAVKVETKSGVPLAFYPHPKVMRGTMWASSRKVMMAGYMHYLEGLEWKGTLRKTAPEQLPKPPKGHWWHDARAIPSSYIDTDLGKERFLFYEATAEQKPVIRAQLSRVALELKNSFEKPVGPVVVLVNDGRGVRGVERKAIPPGKPTLIAKAELAPWSADTTLEVCRRQWLALGMTPEEAEGIVKVWTNDLLNRLGVLVISPMPRPLYDEMFPLTIKPEPDELVRAGLVFDTLPGQDARRQWLPALDAQLRMIGAQLASEKFSERAAAQFAFRSACELGLPVLKELGGSDDPEVLRRVKGLTRRAAPQAVNPQFIRPRSKEHAASLVEYFWPRRKGERNDDPGLPPPK